jgi:hypothetical protein
MNEMLRKLFCPERGELMRNLENECVTNFVIDRPTSSCLIVTVVKTRRLRWVEHVDRMVRRCTEQVSGP